MKNTTNKGKILETIVTMLEQSLSDDPNVSIKTNHKLPDSDGIKREIDIFIETIRSKRIFRIAIECKNYKSPISLEKIDSYIIKCKKLKIDRAIFVTTSNYQKGAIKRAENENIDLLILKNEKLSKENIQSNFNIKKLNILNKEYRFVNILVEIHEDEKIRGLYKNLFNIDKKQIKIDLFEQIIINENLEQLYSYLFTENGFLLNYKKILYPTFKVEKLYLKQGKKFHKINRIHPTIEIWCNYQDVIFEEVSHYKDILLNQVLSSFISQKATINHYGLEIHSLRND